MNSSFGRTLKTYKIKLWEKTLRHLVSCLERKLKTLLNTSFTLTLQSLYEKTFHSYGHMHSVCSKLLILRPCLAQHFTDQQLTYRKLPIGNYWFKLNSLYSQPSASGCDSQLNIGTKIYVVLTKWSW